LVPDFRFGVDLSYPAEVPQGVEHDELPPSFKALVAANSRTQGVEPKTTICYADL